MRLECIVRKLRKPTAFASPSLVAAILIWRRRLRLSKAPPFRVQNTRSSGWRCLLAFHRPIRALFVNPRLSNGTSRSPASVFTSSNSPFVDSLFNGDAVCVDMTPSQGQPADGESSNWKMPGSLSAMLQFSMRGISAWTSTPLLKFG